VLCAGFEIAAIGMQDTHPAASTVLTNVQYGKVVLIEYQEVPLIGAVYSSVKALACEQVRKLLLDNRELVGSR